MKLVESKNALYLYFSMNIYISSLLFRICRCMVQDHSVSTPFLQLVLILLILLPPRARSSTLHCWQLAGYAYRHISRWQNELSTQ